MSRQTQIFFVAISNKSIESVKDLCIKLKKKDYSVRSNSTSLILGRNIQMLKIRQVKTNYLKCLVPLINWALSQNLCSMPKHA